MLLLHRALSRFNRIKFILGVLVVTVVSVNAFDENIPANCPFARSSEVTGIALTGLHKEYAASDTWWPSWAENDTCYSPFMDGDGAKGQWDALLGFGTIVGSNPMNLIVNPLKTISTTVYSGNWNNRYATTILSHNGVIYYGSSYRYADAGFCYMRPFAGFNISTDNGATWTTRNGALFSESDWPKIKLGEPHFVDFGRNMANSPDGQAYLVAFGASDPDSSVQPQEPHWCWADCLYLFRVTPSPANMNDSSKYEFYAGKDAQGNPVWVKEFSGIKPLLKWDDNMGQVGVTYIPALGKYIMCVTDGRTYSGVYNTYFLESNDLTGPWKIITYWAAFGQQAYFVNIPSKFVASDLQGGELSAWIVYSANFTGPVQSDPPGSKYAMCWQQIKIRTSGSQAPESSIVNDDKFTYGSGWNYDNSSARASDFNGDIHWKADNNAQVQYTFSGTGVDYISDKNNDLGEVDIYIDGVFNTTVSAYNSIKLYQQTLFSKRDLSAGSHTIKVVKKNGSYAAIDALKIYSEPPSTSSNKRVASAQLHRTVFMSPSAITIIPALGEKLTGITAYDLFGKRLPITISFSADRVVINRNKFPAGLFILDIHYSNNRHERIVTRSSSVSKQ